MSTGLANGSDGLTEASLSGIATYGSLKISNPIVATGVSEVIQKMPTILKAVSETDDKESK